MGSCGKRRTSEIVPDLWDRPLALFDSSVEGKLDKNP